MNLWLCAPKTSRTLIGLAFLLAVVVVAAPARGAANDFTWTPTTPNIGQAVNFRATYTSKPQSVRWSFGQAGCTPSTEPAIITLPCLFDGCPVTFHFASSGVKTVTMAFPGTGTGCTDGYCVKATHQVTVSTSGSCGAAVAPSAPNLLSPTAGKTVSPGPVTFSWQASSGTTPIYYVVKYGTATICPSQTATSCSATLSTLGTAEWYVTATNSAGTATSAKRSLTVASSCAQTAAPTANFTWAPNAPVVIGGVTQNQPYEGQLVQLTDQSTNSPTGWDWTDFSATTWPHLAQQNPTYTWTTPGAKVVRLTATNCFGTSTQVSKTVTVAADVRPVTAHFTMSPEVPATGQTVTFSADTADQYGNPTHFTWNFGDGTSPITVTSQSVTHVYDCARSYVVTLTASRTKSTTVSSTPVTATVEVTGNACAARELLIMDVARNASGVGGSIWNTDVKIFNSTTDDMILKLRYRTPGVSGVTSESPSFLLHAGGMRTLENVLVELAPHWVGYTSFVKACVWLYHADVDDRGVAPLPLVSARTYTGAAPTYDDYGMMLPVLSVVGVSARAQVLYLLGAEHNGTVAQQQQQGFRTNLTIVDPAGAGIGGSKIKLTLLRPADPSYSKAQSLAGFTPYFYMSGSVPSFFSGVGASEDLGSIVIRVDVAANTAVAIGASLNSNSTNDPATILPVEGE